MDCDASELVQFFDSHSKPVIAKSVQYLPVYRRHLDRFRLDKEIVLLEIGVGAGGAQLMWRMYFAKGGATLRYFAIDINPWAPE